MTDAEREALHERSDLLEKQHADWEERVRQADHAVYVFTERRGGNIGSVQCARTHVSLIDKVVYYDSLYGIEGHAKNFTVVMRPSFLKGEESETVFFWEVKEEKEHVNIFRFSTHAAAEEFLKDQLVQAYLKMWVAYR